MNDRFDDIRPYNNEEFLQAMQRLISSTALPYLNQYIFPGKPIEELQSLLNKVRNVDEFQIEVMYYGIKKIIDLSTRGLTWSGFENLDKTKPYLFISNHRDIALDPALLDWTLISNSHKTVEISFGNNLLFDSTYEDIAKSNKMFIVKRGGTMREMLENSKHLSEYIREAITIRKSSVWLAQRNGRTKDGYDATDQGIMKMLSLSNSEVKTNIESLAELNIVPMAISYEIEPCDILKARETYIKRRDGIYVKTEGEDKNSVLTGMLQQKGHVHIAVGKPITLDDISKYSDYHINNLNHELSELLDKRIRSIYHLMPTNFIAHDLLSGNHDYSDKYTAEESCNFQKYLDSLLEKESDLDSVQLREILLKIYSNCVDNYYSSI